MKPGKFMRRRMLAGILAVMMAAVSATPAQVAAQGLAGIETERKGETETKQETATGLWESETTSVPGTERREGETDGSPDTGLWEGETGAIPDTEMGKGEAGGAPDTEMGKGEAGGAPDTEMGKGEAGVAPDTEMGKGEAGGTLDTGVQEGETGIIPDAGLQEGETGGSPDTGLWEGETGNNPDTGLWGETGGTSDMELPTEPGTETAADVVLADTNGDARAAVFLQDGGTFPEGTSFRLLCVEDIIGETEDKETRCRKLKEELLAAWSDALPEKTAENVRTFLPYYLFFADAQGNEITLPGEVKIRLTISKEAFRKEDSDTGKGGAEIGGAESSGVEIGGAEIGDAENDAAEGTETGAGGAAAFPADTEQAAEFSVAWQGKLDAFREISEKEMILDEEAHEVTFIFRTKEAGWFSILETFEKTETQEGTVESGEPGESNGKEDLGEAEGTGQGETEEITENREESTEETEETTENREKSTEEPEVMADPETGEEPGIGLESLSGIQLFAVAGSLAPSGTLVTASGSGFRLMSTAELDGACRTACWYSGISSFVPFSAAGSSVKAMSGSANGGAYIFYPTDNTAAGKFGGIYQKVLFQEGVWYDLKMTVSSYTNKTWAGSDGAQVASYPPIGFSQNKIAWWLKPTMGEYVLKMEYFRHGDAKQTPVALNSRFQWWEIDNSQRFGIRVENGSIAKKFYQSAGSAVYYKSQAAKADGKTYLFLTATEDMLANDPKGNVGFVLQNCSRYYVAVGYRDHIQDSSDYRVSKATIEKWNTSLKNGKPDEVTLGILVQTGLDVPNPPDPSYPKKYVSNDGASWAQSNTLPGTTAEYYYKIEQYIPWQTPNNYYEQMVLEDVLPVGADYVGPVTITCMESGQDASGSFRCVQKNDTVSITPVNLKNESLYGRTYAFVFKVRMNPEELQPEQTQNTAVYKVINSAALAYKHSGQTAVSMASNKVTTQATVQRQAFPAPVKGLDGQENLREKELSGDGEAIVFSIFQTVPHNEKAWQPVQMILTDELEPCLEYVSAEVFCKGTGGYTPAPQWKAQAQGQSITVSGNFQTNPPAPDNQTLRFDITCRLKKDYDMKTYAQTAGNRRWYVVPNKARMKVVWAKGSPSSEEKETNEVKVKLLAGAVEAQLRITKEIDAADIVWAHGNPTFTFCISGEDVLGGRHTWYRTVEFTPGSAQASGGTQTPGSTQVAGGTQTPGSTQASGGTQTPGGTRASDSTQTTAGKTSLSVLLTVPAGWYTVSEEKTMRYRLQSIHSLENGILSGETAVFDVSGGQTGSAVFYNQKTTDEKESHSAFVKNEIKK
ncbi:hypothetical protein BRYFOR_05147 [Marvinbryantia formatexigens DSM 14469]|uniref:Uncharacterized protein n=1 Tax=Marvinbryantia formatexigens DSM 14469 TaxID=478749 RepID=C6L957_9FIRM|nr:hypothetical protein [Marvinbryantia formatexigens]EET62796.1 hypothetical protein BRYFOR_05147 [Marvinbryantia formatexigens DSM 14469]UWO23149.1 hypothetical protein NQ534_11815 [Marvinbryantia formatexigens DSM 14469]SDG01379.1 fimbrial isopeptide formation D2 domain-containing protein [Marvinbryantia formatexigens]